MSGSELSKTILVITYLLVKFSGVGETRIPRFYEYELVRTISKVGQVLIEYLVAYVL